MLLSRVLILVFIIVVLDMARKASNQLTLFECFHSESSASSSRVQPNRSIRSRSASPEPSAGSHVSATIGSVQVNRSIGESLYDEIVPDSPVSISSESWDSQANEDHEGIADELLLSSSSSTACDTTENVVANSSLPSASYGNSVDSSKGPSDIAQTPAFPPVRPTNARFPTTMFSNKARSFNPLWYKTYDWLEYSVEMDACFCYPCRMFGAQGSQFGSRPESTFTLNGYRDWKHATGKSGVLNGHAKCFSHKQAQAAWSQYKLNHALGKTLPERMGKSHSEAIQQNRHYLKTIAEVILLCAKQDLALRGHREGPNSDNRGNFLEILNVVAKHDPIVQRKLTQGPRNATYTSGDIQNDMLDTMAEIVRNKITTSIKNAGIYSIMADETRDYSKKEQLSIVVRCVDVESANVYEHFLAFTEATSLNAESLCTYILNTLDTFKLDSAGIVSQGYDGASVMSGHCSGVQQRIKQVAPQAVYVHCHAHCLNLALVDTAKRVQEAAEFFVLMEVLYVFLTSSKAHVTYTQQQRQLDPKSQIRQLQRLSDTRWACRYFAVDAVYSTYKAVLSTLQIITEGDDRAKAVEAEGILLQVKSFKFLVTLVLFWRILSCTKSLSDHLQSAKTDLAKASELIEATLETLQSFRTDTEWDKHYKYITDAASLFDIAVMPLRPRRSRQLPQRLRDAIVLESHGSREASSTSHDIKISVYYPILDSILSEIKKRFDNKNVALMKAVQSCSPLSSEFLEMDRLMPLVESYGFIDNDLLRMECVLAKRTLADKVQELETINDVLAAVIPFKAAFPNLVKLLQLSLTIVVSTAECERSFSALKRIKSYLRSTMSTQRLSNLTVLSIERKLSESLSLDEVVDLFAAKDKNRRIAL